MAQPAATDFSETAIAARVEVLKERLNALSPSKIEMPTFVYLDIGGIGWPIRVIFAVAGQKFDDIRIPFEDWMGAGTPNVFKEKTLVQHFPNGHVPLYVDKDVELQESLVIMEYLGKKFGLMGQGMQEELMVKQVLIQAYDAIFHYDGIFTVNFGKNQKPPDYAKKQQSDFAYFFNGKMMVFSGILARNPANSGFMVGKKLTVADLFCFHVICNWYKCYLEEYFPGDFAQKYPELELYIQRISGIPEIGDYISTKQSPTTWLPNVWGECMGMSRHLSTPTGLVGLVAASPAAAT